jgi:hypothetical protein
MGKGIKNVYVPTNSFATAANRYAFTTSFEGVSTFSAFAAKFMNMRFFEDTVGNKVDYNCGNFASGKLIKTPMKWTAWRFAVDQFATKINSDFGSGVPAANSDAVFLLSLFVNMSYIQTEKFTTCGYTDFINYWEDPTHFVPARFSPQILPSVTANGIVLGNGTGALVDGTNTIKAIGLDIFNGYEGKFEIKTIGGDGNYSILGTNTATVTAGIFNVAVTISYTSGLLVPVFSLQAFSHADYGGNVFNTNFQIGTGYAGVQADLEIFDKDSTFIFA